MDSSSLPQRRRSIRLKGYDYSQPGAYFVTICVRDGRCLLGQVVDSAMRLNDAGRMVREVWDALPEQYPGVEIDAFVVMPNHVHGIIVLTGDLVGATGEARKPAPTGGPETDESVGATPRGCPIGRSSANYARGQALGPAPTGGPVMDESVGATRRGCPVDKSSANCARGQALGPAPTGGPETDESVGATPRGCPVGKSSANYARGQARKPAPTGGMSLPDVVHRFKSFTTARYRHGVKDHGWPPFAGTFRQRNYWERVIRDERGLRQIQEYIMSNPARWAEDRMHPDAPMNPFARGASGR